MTDGAFVAIEGPNGVGKSTVIAAAVRLLEVETGRVLHVTKEPSSTALGEAIRSLEPSLPPRALALACAADRLDHLGREIEPALSSGAIVLSDRYVPSSLVLQRIDGLELEEIWALNSDARAPSLTVYLTDDASAIDARLSARGTSARFEAPGSAARELRLYDEARRFLADRGWRQAGIDCRERGPTDVARELTELVAEVVQDL